MVKAQRRNLNAMLQAAPEDFRTNWERAQMSERRSYVWVLDRRDAGVIYDSRCFHRGRLMWAEFEYGCASLKLETPPQSRLKQS